MKIILFLLVQAPCTEAKPAPPRIVAVADTALFVDAEANGDTLKAHGDTVWSIVGKRSIRVVEKDGWIHRRVVTVEGKTYDQEYCIKGDRAVPAGVNAKGRPVSLASIQAVKRLVESSKRIHAALSRAPE